MIKRAKAWIRRKRNSVKFGVPFSRSSRITIPETIQLQQNEITLQAPNEHGALADFGTIFLDDCYGLFSIDLDTKSPHILDIGANIGLFDVAARKVYPSSKIHAYEPNPRLERYLSHHAQEASYQYFMEAVGPQADTVQLIRGADSNLTQVDAKAGGTIPMIALETAIERMGGTVDLLKLDCEGAEWPLFEIREPWPSIRHVVMEYHLWASPKTDHRDVRARMQDLGYVVINHRYASDADVGMMWTKRAS